MELLEIEEIFKEFKTGYNYELDGKTLTINSMDIYNVDSVLIEDFLSVLVLCPECYEEYTVIEIDIEDIEELECS